MNAEQKQALIEWLKSQIHKLEKACDEIPFGLDADDALQLQAMHATLAALTAQPVKLPAFPHSTQEIDLALGYRDRDWIEAIRAAGYEVEGE